MTRNIDRNNNIYDINFIDKSRTSSIISNRYNSKQCSIKKIERGEKERERNK